MRARGKRLVVTNGCFDVLHLGHVTYLETARSQGDALLVGVNGDAAVHELKGPDRPVNPEADRAALLAALESVDGVCIFAEATAIRFLTVAEPDIYVKGGDYTLDTLNQEERRSIEQARSSVESERRKGRPQLSLQHGLNGQIQRRVTGFPNAT